jgi:hypothetical protein
MITKLSYFQVRLVHFKFQHISRLSMEDIYCTVRLMAHKKLLRYARKKDVESLLHLLSLTAEPELLNLQFEETVNIF